MTGPYLLSSLRLFFNVKMTDTPVKICQDLTLKCPQGWTEILSTCYLPVTDLHTTWRHAYTYCQRFGGKLAEPAGEDQTKQVSRLITNTTTSHWIGFTQNGIPDNAPEQGFWSDDKPTTVDAGWWDNFQPDRRGGDCTVLRYTTEWKWYMTQCLELRPFICETTSCPTDTFRCLEGECLNTDIVCDGKADCLEGWDEINCASDCNQYLQSSEGQITHPPNQLSTYSPRTTCQWTIHGTEGHNLVLDISELDLEDGIDYLEIWTSGLTISTSRLHSRLTGTNLQNLQSIYSSNNCAIIRLVTDPSNQFAGFTLDWESVSDLVSGDTVLQATGVYQQLSSPLYPNIYLDNLYTAWLIKATGSNIITIEITDLDISSNGKVTIFDGDSPGSPVLKVLTHGIQDSVILSTSSAVHILYESGTSDPVFRKGFQLKYKEGCNFVLAAAQGEISSPGYSRGKYPNILDCTWLISSQSGTPLTLQFNSIFSIEQDKDFLKVFRSSSENDPAHSGEGFTGVTVPALIVSGSGSLLIKFTTSALGQAKGFMATFSAGCKGLQSPYVHAFPHHATYHLNEVLNVTCTKNHIFSNVAYLGLTSVLLTCTAGGNFDKEIPICSKTLCGPAPEIRNGYIRSSNGVYSGSTVTYSCNFGYNLTSSSTITCQNSGQWPIPSTCHAESCPPVPDISNGNKAVIYGDGVSQGSVVKYTCQSTFQIVGVNTRTCQNGKWSAVAPTCQRIPCGYTKIENGVISVLTQPYQGEQVTLRCNTGYHISSGSDTFPCGEIPPLCVNINECTSRTDNCVKSQCKDTDGSFECVCNPGYYKPYNGANTCQDINECNVNNGGCGQICNNVDGSYTCSCYDNNVLFTTNGQNGYFVRSGETGTDSWNSMRFQHTCIPVECPVPPRNIGNGRSTVSKLHYQIGDQVSFVCNIGYVPQGTTTITCQSNGSWDFTPPLCLDATCPYPEVPNSPNAVSVTPTNSIRYLDVFTLTCPLPTQSSQVRPCIYDQANRDYRIMSGSLECPETDCGRPERIPGSDPYSNSCTTYGCSFNFRCRTPWFQVAGSSSKGNTVTCGSDGHWDFGDLRCPGPTCTDPGTPAGGKQIYTTYEEYSLVYYKCNENNQKPGFEPSAQYPLKCIWNSNRNELMWNDTTPTCVDRTAPVFFNCPTMDIKVSRMSTSTVAEPQITDNSGAIQSLRIYPDKFSVNHVIKSDESVRYEATDHSGNTGFCAFNIKLKDEQKPVIKCRDSFGINFFNENDFRSFDVNSLIISASDDSGNVDVTGSVDIIRLDRNSIGKTYTNTITATDPSGNTASCIIQVTATADKCRPWTLQIQNGGKNCNSKSGGGYICTVTCNNGYVFYDNTAQSSVDISCDPNGDWSREVPVCVAVESSIYELAIRVTYVTDSNIKDYCPDNYQKELTGKMPSLVSSLSSRCQSLSPSIRVEAGRSTTIQNFNSGVYAIFYFNLEPRDYDSSTYSNCVNLIRQAFIDQSQTVSAVRQLSVNPNIGCPGSQAGTYQTIVNDGFTCNVNEEVRQISQDYTGCVTCPLGYYSTDGRLCIKCLPGFYRDQNLQSCVPCLSNSRNQTEGASSIHECYSLCPMGMNSNSGRSPCSQCRENSYSQDERTCRQCPPNTFTPGRGAASVDDCRGICQPGYYSTTGFEPCQVCPRGFFQSNTRSTTCFECSLDQTTFNTASTSSSQCTLTVDIDCQNGVCQNGGTCLVEKHQYYCRCTSGYTGKNCETPIRACDSSPCFNDGVCSNNDDGSFTCFCNQGRFSGGRCENDINDCSINSCLNNGSCYDDIGSFSCVCPIFSGFTGGSCQRSRDVCSEQPCQNSGQCIASGNIRRKCVCQLGYTGDNCEAQINECSSSPCRNRGTCIDQQNRYECRCMQGYTGSNCEILSDPCSTFVCNNGDCLYNYQTATTDCVCFYGYEKVNGQCQAINPCQSSPCKNGGTCRPGNSTYTCDCLAGYEGTQCQQNRDDCASSPCKNGATCVDQLNDYRCECDINKPDTRGKNCEDQVNSCSSNPCKGNNTKSCTDHLGYYECDCYNGYSGLNCQDLVNHCASYPCLHGGSCTNIFGGYKCLCTATYTGSRCERATDFCTQESCRNGGQCISTDTGYVCSCKNGFKGQFCENTYDLCSKANPCVGTGSICSYDGTRFTCQCSGGYTGDYCEFRNNVCSDSRCLHGGTCLEVGGQPQCQCASGYTGSLCETNINDCTTTSCGQGAQCIDGVNTFTCECESGKIGRNCDKDLTYDFDMTLSKSGQFLASDYFILPQRLQSTTMFSLSFWVRYSKSTDPGLILTMYGTRSQDKLAESFEILRIVRDKVTAYIGNTQSISYSEADIDDGKWHHVVVTWDGTFPLLTLYIDNTEVEALNYVLNPPLPTYIWFVLGGTYDVTTNKIDQSKSMIGRMSRLFVTPSVLSAADRLSLSYALSFVPANHIQGFTVGMLDGVNALVDHNSELNPSGCYRNKTCPPLLSAGSKASVSVCPSDMMTVSARVSRPTWPQPIFTNTDVIRTNYISGGEPMSWKTYSIAFGGYDTQGNADVCSYNLYNRRAACPVPKKPLLGTINCVSIQAGVRCTVTCGENQRLAEPTPVYYSCGFFNAYNENILTYRYPSCTSCEAPKLDVEISMTFDLQASCTSIGESVIASGVRSSLNDLNTRLNQQLCGGNDCSSISISARCSIVGQDVNIVVRMFSLRSTMTVNRLPVSTANVLASSIIDDTAITVNLGTLDRMSYDLQSTRICEVGRQLVSDCCAECGFGTYYDTSRSTCVQCQRGTYLDTKGVIFTSTAEVASPCKACPGGMTTALTGSQTVDECKDSCSPGRFYNLTIGRCEDCPAGYFQETAGTFFCQPCSITSTTANNGSMSSSDCVLASSIAPETTTPLSEGTDSPSVGASTGSDIWSGEVIALAVIAVLVIIVLILVILCVCCRGCLQSICPCCVTKVSPVEKTQWQYVNRFGETNLKFVSYKLSDIRRKKLEKEALMKAEEPRKISIQVPVFEEKLDGKVKKKSLHVSRPTSGRPPQSTSIPIFSVNSPGHYQNQPKPLPPLPDRIKNTPPNSPITIRRPPSAFNKPRVQPTEDDYKDFILRNNTQATDSRITIDSDEEDYR
ncbi:hypothetical protein LOTGIDRAFT_234340 [Lottia gigantea]|uniref:Fibropellin-1 n=1 Tax=Lottia gigantea TaxID=225164 RepID=V3ZEG9_LOTGI|nr:hypothetical protein LOTGIDRAFT_234340 [Lottia gigantea]ESO89533.1 hypothetical protein LOTGIDRAFT_234340 [Lottia gigantea]